MRKVYLLFILLITGLASAVAQVSVPEPLCNITFKKENSSKTRVQNTGTAGNAVSEYTTNVSRTGTVVNPMKTDGEFGQYIGYTSGDIDGYYWCKYNADDDLGKAFASTVTWEFLFRFDKYEGTTRNKYTVNKSPDAEGETAGLYGATIADASTGTTKFFSSQQSGGWSFAHYPHDGMKFQYVQTDGTDTFTPGFFPETGKFYHIVLTLNKSKKKVVLYVNGSKHSEYTLTKKNAFKYPGIGTTTRSKDMWFNLGGDPASVYTTIYYNDKDGKTINKTYSVSTSTTEPNLCENAARTSWVFAKIYGEDLSEAQALSLYTDDVKYYTEPTCPNKNDIMLDAVFGDAGAYADHSAYTTDTEYSKGIPVLGVYRYGTEATQTITTKWNSTLKRYEMVSPGTDKKYLIRRFMYDPSWQYQMSDGFSYEVYCKANTFPPASNSCPMSAQQAGGFGFQFNTDKTIAFYMNAYGYSATKKGCDGTQLKSQTAAADEADPAFSPTGYCHYVLTFDKASKKTYIYVNGVQQAENSPEFPDCTQEPSFSYARYQWMCIGGDAKNNIGSSCDFPFAGSISIARVWSKALTATDVTSLYGQATGTSTTVTTGTNGLATAIFPYPAVVPAGAAAYVVNVIKGSEAAMAPYATAGEIIPYGTPVIVKGTASTDYTFNAAGEAAVAKAAPVTNLLIGSFASKKAKADQLYAINASAARFDKVAADGTVAAQQAWLPVEDAGVSTLTLTEDVILTEETGASTLKSYTAGDVLNAKFSREFAGGKSSTVCLPFAVTSVSGGTLYSFSGVSEVDGEYVVYMSAASSPTTANTPYLFVPAADGEVTFSGSITIPATATAGSTVSGDWAFTGTYERIDWDALPVGCTAVYGYAAQAQNTISPGDFVKVKMGGSAYTPVFRAVMKYSEAAPSRSLKGGSQPSAPQRLKVVLQDANGNVTGIDSMEVIQNADEWFTIDGKRLQGKPTTKGIYIRDGKKVWVSK